MPDAYRTSEIRKIKKAGTAEDVKETFNSIGDRQFRAVATKVQKSASQVAFLFLSRNLDMSARQTASPSLPATTSHLLRLIWDLLECTPHNAWRTTGRTKHNVQKARKTLIMKKKRLFLLSVGQRFVEEDKEGDCSMSLLPVTGRSSTTNNRGRRT
ncbi:hypothetical protein I315_01678 [Cryptococcus gattii Ru294]|nr:hypothetical protein I315_01678 [Cryptococcus gattii Ru294]